MISSLSGQGVDQIDLERKRAAFRATSHVYGLLTQTTLSCRIFAQSSDPGRLDVCRIAGFYGLRRLRRGAPLMLSRHRLETDYGGVDSSTEREPLDVDEQSGHGVPLLRQFCSRPVPQLRVSELSTSDVQVDLVGREIGILGDTTCVLGDVWRRIQSPLVDDTTPRIRINPGIAVPTEVFILDVMLPRDLFGEIKPQLIEPKLMVFTSASMLDLSPGHEDAGLLPIQESVDHLGTGLDVMHTSDVPRYGEMLRYTFKRLGWDPEKFDVFRCRVQYPVMHSVISMRFDLPERATMDPPT